jgi:hypothetical protein
MSSVKQEFKSTKELVLHILEKYPETRSSDNKLFVRCAQHLGAVTLSDLDNIKLNLISVHKVRQKINREGLFLPSAETLNIRSQRAKEVKEFMIS